MYSKRVSIDMEGRSLMKLLVFADSHGRTIDIYDAIEREQPDGVIHLGDYTEDVRELRRAYACSVMPIYAVRGNNDYDSDFPMNIVMTLGGVPMYLSHGHRERVSGMSPGVMAERARQNGCKLAMFGHTHRLFLEMRDGVMVFNPGSISLPRGGKRSYGRVTVENGEFQIEPVTL